MIRRFQFLLAILMLMGFLKISVLTAQETPIPAATPTTPVEATPPAATPTPAPTPTPPPPEPDGGWPRVITSAAGSQIQIHQPQVENWDDQKKMVAWAAVEFLAEGKTNSELGVVKWEALTSVALEERLVKLENIQIKQVSFPTLDQTKSREVTTALADLFPKEGLIIALDRVIAAIDKSTIRAVGVTINQNPPPIFYASRPAMLVQFDGEPIISPIKDSDLKYIVNTNWDIVQDPKAGIYYMRYEKSWLQAEDIEKTWKPVKKLPESFATLPNDENWADVRAAMPAKSISKSKMPLLYVSKKPAELIVTKGKPKGEPIGKSKLLWIKNTEVDLFQMKKGPYYFLVSGRWFKADKLEGPWTFATPELPKEFTNIPRNHPRARIRASIPGTDEAAEAVLLAQIPQTLRISRKDLSTPSVKYQGEPEFKEIKDINVSYAVNCSNDVLKAGSYYYLCFQGAWFRSRKAEGPWELTSEVPDNIYKIPSDCPLHHVTYVRVAGVDPESISYVQTSGYSGVTVSFGVSMWGTGWYYPPYYYGGGYYPVYYPYPHSYGSYAVYNSRTGAYGYGSSVSGPRGGLSHAATYNPNTGTYARGTAAYGPSGSQMRGSAYNPRTGTSMETRQNRNAQGSWGSTKVQRGDDWAQTGHAKNDQGSIRGGRTSEGNGVVRAKGENGSGFVGKKGDDIYAGKDGNVYRKTDDGWQQHTENGWNDVNRGEGQPKVDSRDNKMEGGRENKGSAPSAGTHDQLNRDASARNRGNERVQSSNSNRSSGSYNRNRGSYSGGGGGGARRSGGGGGGRRR